MRALLLGFEPFRKRKINPSWEVAKDTARRFPASRVILPSAPLPVDYRRAPLMGLSLVRKTAPDLVIALGLAAGEPGIRLERFAFNAYLPEDRVAASVPEILRRKGPDAIRTRAPVEAAAARLQKHKIPVRVSNTPGLFVCNALYYTLLLQSARQNPRMLVLFVHLPLLPRQASRPDASLLPSMPLSLQSRAVAHIIGEVKRRCF